MLISRLILVEGFPGAGKSTTTGHIGTILQQHGIACRWYLEEDDPHPIACLDFDIKGLPEKMIPLWSGFVDHAKQESLVTIMESRLWQNTALFMYMSNCQVGEIIHFNRQLGQVLAPLSPLLVYLDQEDTEAALLRLYTLRGVKWMQEALEMATSYPWFQFRGLMDFSGWVQFFTEWQRVVTQLFNDWPHHKIKIHNPHDDWERAYQQIDAFIKNMYLLSHSVELGGYMKATIIKIFTENSDFQYIKTLQRNRTKRNRAREFVVEGVRSITQAMRNQWRITALIYSRDRRLSDWAEGVIEHSEAQRHYILPVRLMEKLSQKDDTSELIAIAAMPEEDLGRIPEQEDLLVVVLDRSTNPGNLGTVIRSCDALQVDGVIITGHSVDLYDPETVRATTGSFFSLPVVRLPSYKELIPWFEKLRQRLDRFQIIGTSAKAEIPIQNQDFTAPTILLVGNESHGLSDNFRALCDAIVTIPMYGSATSLNVACATSILLYEVDRQRRTGDRV